MLLGGHDVQFFRCYQEAATTTEHGLLNRGTLYGGDSR
jgi:hypothetical protein